ncbi:hypothetical protein [Sphingomonas sp.]|uniref:hypothetical protein n=1 Tax=Sphingomonas sp. TaxID=28214 RepID=UPI003B3B559F
MNIDALFETNVVMASVPDAPAINAALAPLLMRASQGAAAAPIAWHGPVPQDAGVAEQQAIARLTDHAIALARAYTERGEAAAPVPRWTAHIRMNVVRFGQSPSEIAPAYDAYWTADYMVDDGYGGSPDRALAGELILEDPRLPATMMELPDLRLRLSADPRGVFYDPQAAIRPTSGVMLLLPTWLRRHHRPLRTRQVRSWVSIALTPAR